MDDIELDIPSGTGKAVIEGKTAVPFRTFVTLILQRKVQHIFKTSQDEPVIVSSDLLTKLASAPSDKQEDRSKLTLVTFGVGVIAGIFISAAALLGLLLFRIQISVKDLSILLGGIGVVVVIAVIVLKTQRRAGFKEKLQESMEKVTELVSR
jgi:hypothetical protein